MNVMRICMIMVRYSHMRQTSVFPEVCRLLREWGVNVDIMFPQEVMANIGDLQIEHDLYVLKSKSEAALSLGGLLHAAGANILNPYPLVRMMGNKVVATRVLKEAGVPVPESYVAPNARMLAPLLDDGPLVVKPYLGSMGRGVHVVWDVDHLDDISTNMEMVFVQRYQKPEGLDHKIYCIGGQVFGVERVWPCKTYEDKMGKPFSITPELRDIALRCGNAFGVELYGLDVIWSDGKPYVVDISSFPGFAGVPDAALRIADNIFAVGKRVLNGEPMLPEAGCPAVAVPGQKPSGTGEKTLPEKEVIGL
jgi:ribosomal protein S6--L-glutamate ligase